MSTASAAPAAHGVLTGTAPNVTYTPATGYLGTDTFTFKANDGKADEARSCWTKALEVEPALAQGYFGPAID